MNNSMVAHNWAHGREGKGSNFSTDGARLVSYYTLVGYNTGRGLVFLSSYRMTPSTGKQLSYARRACSHLDVIYSPIFEFGCANYGFTEQEAFTKAHIALSAELEELSKARFSKYLYGSVILALATQTELETLAVKYGYTCPPAFEFPADRLAQITERNTEREAKEIEFRAAAAKREAQRREVQRQKDAAQFARWRAGDTVQCPSSYRYDGDGGYYIAVRGDKVVTSGDAECPVEHARRGIEFWCSREVQGKDEFTPWQKNGHRVQLGVFQLDRIEADGTAYAGCHKFNVAELNRLADLLL